MIKNVIQYAVNGTGEVLSQTSSTIRGWSNCTDVLQVLSPEPIDTIVKATIDFKDARYSSYTVLLLPTQFFGVDVLEPNHSQLIKAKDWRVWEVALPQECSCLVTRYRSSVIGITFSFFSMGSTNMYQPLQMIYRFIQVSLGIPRQFSMSTKFQN